MAVATTPLPTAQDVIDAAGRISGGVVRTPCLQSVALSQMLGAEVWCKLDLMQATGSFKERGARNALLSLGSTQRERGVISASAGNHALALAFHGKQLGVPVTVVMPRFAPLVKQVRCRQYGARVLLHGDNIADAREHADEVAAADGLAYVNGFNDPAIISGAGTCALEVFDQIPDLDAIVTPVGGGDWWPALCLPPLPRDQRFASLVWSRRAAQAWRRRFARESPCECLPSHRSRMGSAYPRSVRQPSRLCGGGSSPCARSARIPSRARFFVCSRVSGLLQRARRQRPSRQCWRVNSKVCAVAACA